MMWIDCIMLEKDSDLYKEYRDKLGYEPKYNVWFDTIDKVCFGLDRDLIDYCYSSCSFESLASQHFNHMRPVQHPEVFYINTKRLEQFKGKSLLIIGGGPTTNKVDWQSIQTDLTWSCNHFFKHPLCLKKQIDLFILGNEVNLCDKTLNDYMKSHDSIAMFESIETKQETFNQTYPDQCSYMYSKYRSKLGTVPRMIILAYALGVREINFVGMDGLNKDGQAVHSFELGKEPRGTRGYGLFRRQYVEFWDYVLNYLKSKIVFNNLGQGYEENLTTNISRQQFLYRSGNTLND